MRAPLPVLSLLMAAACGQPSGAPDARGPIEPTENWQRDLLSTDLAFDIEARTALARIVFAEGTQDGASLEVGSLDILSVQLDGQDVPQRRVGTQLDLGLAASATGTIEIRYQFEPQAGFEGYRSEGSTLTWPTWCGNLFPCKSDPAEGARYSVSTSGVPRGETAIATPALTTDAPAYMVAFAHGIYEYASRGQTAAGTEVGVYFRPGGRDRALAGGAFLAEYMGFYEDRYGPYAFGPAIAAVSVAWGTGAFGGIEHHPFFHVASAAMSSHEVLAHEVAHGWFGNGVRIACWEDLVLSEGVAQYLTLRAIEDAEGLAAADALWSTIESRLQTAVASADTLAYPDGCQQIDILTSPLFSRIPYEKGAFFLRAVEEQIGRGKLDGALASFYRERVGTAAHMSDLLSHIEAASGESIEPLAQAWLKTLGIPSSS